MLIMCEHSKRPLCGILNLIETIVIINSVHVLGGERAGRADAQIVRAAHQRNIITTKPR